jgi:DnaJ-class molecular chaperone
LNQPQAANKQAEYILGLSQEIMTQDYYQILRVGQDVSDIDIKNAYHKATRAFHPDRFYKIPPGQIKEALELIAKRVTEAYTVLREPQKRQEYTKRINSPERDKYLRYLPELDEAVKQAKQEEIGQTPNGRKYYQLGLVAMKRGRFEEAEKAFKTAIMYEPKNEKFIEAQKQAGASIKTDYKIK